MLQHDEEVLEGDVVGVQLAAELQAALDDLLDDELADVDEVAALNEDGVALPGPHRVVGVVGDPLEVGGGGEGGGELPQLLQLLEAQPLPVHRHLASAAQPCSHRGVDTHKRTRHDHSVAFVQNPIVY